jgi:hypothetical protein
MKPILNKSIAAPQFGPPTSVQIRNKDASIRLWARRFEIHQATRSTKDKHQSICFRLPLLGVLRVFVVPSLHSCDSLDSWFSSLVPATPGCVSSVALAAISRCPGYTLPRRKLSLLFAPEFSAKPINSRRPANRHRNSTNHDSPMGYGKIRRRCGLNKSRNSLAFPKNPEYLGHHACPDPRQQLGTDH